MTKKIIRSAPFNYSLALEREFKNEVHKLIKPMLKETENTVIAIYRKNKPDYVVKVNDSAAFAMDDNVYAEMDKAIKLLAKKYNDLFWNRAYSLAEKMILRQVKYARSVFKKIIKQMMPAENEIPTLRGSAIPADLKAELKANANALGNTIITIHGNYFGSITELTTLSMQAGGSIKQLAEAIHLKNKQTWRQSELMAEDQTRKTYMFVNIRNMAKAGIKKAEWVHSGGGQDPRHYHITKWDGESGKMDGKPNGLNGFIFDIDKPPVIQKEQKNRMEVRGYPAQLPNCRCVMRAIVELDEI